MKDSRRKDFRRIPGGRIFERFQEGGLFKADSRREDSQRIIGGRIPQKVHLTVQCAGATGFQGI